MLASRIRKAMQYADSIDEVVRILSQANNGLYTNEWLIADIKTNEIAMFELGTERTKLWRSSRQEWFGNVPGIYWGCNNVKDRGVLLDTVADVRGKPANAVLHSSLRDQAWLKLFRREAGNIDEQFAFEAFTTPPIAGFHSCDVKFTTAAMAKELKSWALFGPPLGRTWDPKPADREAYPDVLPFVANDWTVLNVTPPPTANKLEFEPVDFAAFPEEGEKIQFKFDQRHPFAWRGTLLPKTDADTWLAAGFAEFEKVVAFENALRREGKGGKLTQEGRDLVDVVLWQYESQWLTALRRLGHPQSPLAARFDVGHDEWYQVAQGSGVMLLSTLRKKIGAVKFDTLMDSFGFARGGQEVATADFVDHLKANSQTDAAVLVERWLKSQTPLEPLAANPWSIYSFECEPDHAIIVYGTRANQDVEREAAKLLQRDIARRFFNREIRIVSDQQVTEAELKDHHVLLVGRPATNAVVDKCITKLPLTFSTGSFTVRGQKYADPESAVIAAGENPLNPRYSVVLYAGLGSHSTWKCVQQLSEDSDPAPQVWLFPARQRSRRFPAIFNRAAGAAP